MRQLTEQAQKGFTLIEALVALLVLSFGLLGVAAMQLKALQSAHAGHQRSIASLAAQDAVERLWAGLVHDDERGYLCPPEHFINNSIFDIDWHEEWSQFLPELTSTPISPPDHSCNYTITIRWDESRFAGNSSERIEEEPEFTYVARLLGEPGP